MELNHKFKTALYNPIEHLPDHGKQAIVSHIEKNPDFFDELIFRYEEILSKTYNFPIGEMNKNYRHIINHVINNYDLFPTINTMYLDESQSEFIGMGDFFYTILRYGYQWNRNARTYTPEFENKIYYLKYMVLLLVNFTQIGESVDHPGMVSRISFPLKQDKNGEYRKVRSRFARVFNAIFPGLPHATVDSLNDLWRDSYGEIDMSKYHFHIGRSEEDFINAYENTNTAETLNITTSLFTKSISNSCMQYERGDRDGWEEEAMDSGLHCVEAYATDPKIINHENGHRYFEVLYLTDNPNPNDFSATIHGRVVLSRRVKDGYPEFGPVYVVNNHVKSMFLKKMRELIDTYVKEKGIEDTGIYQEEFSKFLSKTDSYNSSRFANVWEGSKLRMIKLDGEQETLEEYKHKCEELFTQYYYVGPYIDVGYKNVGACVVNDMMYVEVMNKSMEEYDTFNEEHEAVEKDGMLFRINNWEEHRGLNRVSTALLPMTCESCGKKTFKLINGVCEECLSKTHVKCGITNNWIRKEESEFGTVINHKKNFLFLNDKIDFIKNILDIDSDEKKFISLAFPYKSLTEEHLNLFEDVYFNPNDYDKIDSFQAYRNIYENVFIHKDHVIEMDNIKLAIFDDRLVFDIFDKKLVLEEDLQKSYYISLTNWIHDSCIPITKRSFDYVTENIKAEQNIRHYINGHTTHNSMSVVVIHSSLFKMPDHSIVINKDNFEKTLFRQWFDHSTSEVGLYCKKGNDHYKEGLIYSFEFTMSENRMYFRDCPRINFKSPNMKRRFSKVYDHFEGCEFITYEDMKAEINSNRIDTYQVNDIENKGLEVVGNINYRIYDKSKEYDTYVFADSISKGILYA